MTRTARLSWTDVRNDIRARILRRDYGPGDKLPRDEDIAHELGCARATVHRAMQDLAQLGLIERKRKGGTHVLSEPVTRATFDIPITRVEIEQSGRTYGYHLISQERGPAPAPVLDRCGLSAPTDMLRVQAVHLADNRPFLFEDRWIHTASTPGILSVDLTRHSANEWLVQNAPYSRLDVRLSAVQAAGDQAKHLEVMPGSALFVIRRTTWIGEAPITTVDAAAAPGYELTAQS